MTHSSIRHAQDGSGHAHSSTLLGCDERCHAVRVLVPGALGRADLWQHDPDAHEAWGRAQAHLERGAGAGVVVATGPLVVNLDTLVVTFKDRPLVLTATELRLLCVLARQLGRWVSYEEILVAAWGGDYLVGRTSWMHLLRVNVTRIRRKLGPWSPLIGTFVNVGYRLLAVAPDADPPARSYPVTAWMGLDGGWAIDWACCRACQTTAQAHAGNGLCTRCRSRWRTGRLTMPDLPMREADAHAIAEQRGRTG